MKGAWCRVLVLYQMQHTEYNNLTNNILIYLQSNFKLPDMECRAGCGACCIALSISSGLPGMPDGKTAGVRCIHLLDDCMCAIYNDPSKPKVCSDFKAEPEFCGTSREDALKILFSLSESPPWGTYLPER
jgi:hypothetical protein